MNSFQFASLSVAVDFPAGQITSLKLREKERLSSRAPLFRVGLRNREGASAVVSAYDATVCRPTEDGAVYTGFFEENGEKSVYDMTVRVRLTEEHGDAAWRIAVTPADPTLLTEWVDFPLISLPPLSANNLQGNGGEILFPYNEGVLISDWNAREETGLRYREPNYPSLGSYGVFPNMICSQLLAYLWKDGGLYIGVHDEARGVKGIDFFSTPDGITMQIRLFCGVDFGEVYEPDFPIVWSAIEGRWEAAAEKYRAWFASALPPKVKKIQENDRLPEWYEDAPLVLTYPVRGVHDMDEPLPNALYPYTNALPVLRAWKDATQSRLMVLLMHWEGTAPWAPPYVWPPFGDWNNFEEFRSALHGQGDLLGVYCSGFGYTLQSNLIEDYNRQAEYEEKGLAAGMCAGPDGQVAISRICTGQRSGYDICPASPVGRSILRDAYGPLFENGLDYAQILDQNHGGGQYFCYSRDHGHPPAPGAWMTESMQEMLAEWQEAAPKMLFGCESASAEPFIGNLLFNDNRYELNYRLGVPVPLYAYLYHEYIRNFMGNQVSCPLREEDDENLCYRIAYSFSIGDCMTLVLNPQGQAVPRWGKLSSHIPNQEPLRRLVKNLTKFYKEQGKPYLYAGKMIPALPVACASLEFARRDSERIVSLPSILTSAWEASDGSRGQILVNPTEQALRCVVDGKDLTVPPLDALLISLG